MIKKNNDNKKVIIKKEKIYDNVEEEAFKFIASFEWFYAKPYWDYKHYSVGYWTTTKNPKEVISKEEGKRRAMEKIRNIRKQFNLYDIRDDLEVALISFSYNTWRPPKNYRWYIDNWHYVALGNLMKQYKYAWWKILAWLQKRRQAEVNLFLN